MWRPARNLRCTGQGCPPGRLCWSLESCSSVSSRPTRCQAPGLEGTQERNNPHPAQFILYWRLLQGRCWNRILQLVLTYKRITDFIIFFSVDEPVKISFFTYDQPQKACESSDPNVSLEALLWSAWQLRPLFPTWPTLPGIRDRWFPPTSGSRQSRPGLSITEGGGTVLASLILFIHLHS